MAYTSLSVFVYAILCRRCCGAMTSRVSTTETAAAGALQLCGVRDKLIATERIVRGQHGVFQRVERAADADAGQPTLHREKGEILPVPALQNKLAAQGTRYCSSLRSLASRTFTPFLARYSPVARLASVCSSRARPERPAGVISS